MSTRLTEEQFAALQSRGNHAAPVRAARPLIRQSTKGPNKTETRFELNFLKRWLINREIYTYAYEPITLKLANGLRYTPDWFAIGDDGKVRFFEVKGAHVFDGALDKLKMAADRYPWFEFYLYQWSGDEWAAQKVLS